MKIQEVWKNLEGDLAAVEACIRDHLRCRAPLVSEVGFHLLRGGGKRIRPLLLLLSARACGYSGDRHYLLAGIIEYIHTASLLHDDVVDDAAVRRGRTAANRVWGNQASILVGDYLYSKALFLAVREQNQRIMDVLSEATTVMSEGEVLQLSQIGNLDLSEEEYYEVITYKTAVLISAACHLGAILAGAPAGVCRRMVDYGRKVGIAFQLIDDALDYSAEERKLGKKVGKDLGEGKVTLPLIHAARAATPAERGRLRGILADGGDRAGVEFAFDLVDRHGGVDYTLSRARELIQEAKGELEELRPSPARDALVAVSDFIYQREL